MYAFLQHVMKFAEMTQEIQMLQPTAIKLDFGLTPGRRRANEVSLIRNIISTAEV
jgi:kinesin family protein 23